MPAEEALVFTMSRCRSAQSLCSIVSPVPTWTRPQGGRLHYTQIHLPCQHGLARRVGDSITHKYTCRANMDSPAGWATPLHTNTPAVPTWTHPQGGRLHYTQIHLPCKHGLTRRVGDSITHKYTCIGIK